jgi:hypothetical protein
VGLPGSLTIPELLLILEIIRHLKCHVVVAGLLQESSSPAMKAAEGWIERRKLFVVRVLMRTTDHRVAGDSPALASASPILLRA